MNRTDFQSNENLCAALIDVLRLPAFQYAVSVVLKELEPMDPKVSGGDLIAQAALNGMKHKGALEFFSRLQSLSLPKPKSTQVQTGDDQAIIESMVKGGYSEEEARKAIAELNQQNS